MPALPVSSLIFTTSRMPSSLRAWSRGVARLGVPLAARFILPSKGFFRPHAGRHAIPRPAKPSVLEERLQAAVVTASSPIYLKSQAFRKAAAINWRKASARPSQTLTSPWRAAMEGVRKPMQLVFSPTRPTAGGSVEKFRLPKDFFSARAYVPIVGRFAIGRREVMTRALSSAAHFADSIRRLELKRNVQQRAMKATRSRITGLAGSHRDETPRKRESIMRWTQHAGLFFNERIDSARRMTSDQRIQAAIIGKRPIFARRRDSVALSAFPESLVARENSGSPPRVAFPSPSIVIDGDVRDRISNTVLDALRANRTALYDELEIEAYRRRRSAF
jgi:hypothetical protein